METNDSGCQSLKQRKCECPRYKWFYSVESDRYQRRREFQDQWKSKVKHYRQNPRLWTLIWKGLFGAKRKSYFALVSWASHNIWTWIISIYFFRNNLFFLSLETILRQSPVWPLFTCVMAMKAHYNVTQMQSLARNFSGLSMEFWSQTEPLTVDIGYY